jgi:peptidoglycan hydrolase-like protein with peptidoglycan-binding domain
MHKRLLIGASVILATGALALPIGGGVASAACSVSGYQTQQERGQDSDSVRCLQQALHDHGVDAGPVDGWFGPVTEAAVYTFQTGAGITMDGQVGQETAAALGVEYVRQQRQQSSGNGSGNAAPTQRASSGGGGGGGGGGTVWDRLAQCESGGNWSIATGNGYFGGLQFLPSSWRAAGGSGMPHEASREEQIRVAENLRNQVGSYRPWPACARKLGLL